MKNSADLRGCYRPRPSASVDNTLLDLQNSSYPTQPHSIIANCHLGRSAQEHKRAQIKAQEQLKKIFLYGLQVEGIKAKGVCFLCF